MGSKIEEIISLMDLLDLDETVIDGRLSTLLNKNNLSSNNLKSIITLLQYKHLINSKENSECENDQEYKFLAKLVTCLDDKNVNFVCEITSLTLSLNLSSVCFKAEHFLQQLLVDVNTKLQQRDFQTLLNVLKVITSILKAVINNNQRASLFFMDAPIENILYCGDEELTKYFVSHTVPVFVDGVDRYSVLTNIWNSVQKETEHKDTALKILSSLSDYFIPADSLNESTELNVLESNQFWNFIAFGLLCDDVSLRKMALYLTKRAVDACLINHYNMNIKSMDGEDIFIWNSNGEDVLKQIWDDYFVLFESLEELQTNIVLPALQLVYSVKSLGSFWLNFVFKLGLQHDILAVREKCLEIHLKYGIGNINEARILIECLNDGSMYEHLPFKELLHSFFQNENNMKIFLQVIDSVRWTVLPLYYITDVLAIKYISYVTGMNEDNLTDLAVTLLQNPCNHVIIREAVESNILTFLQNHYPVLKWQNLVKIISKIPISKKTFLTSQTTLGEWLDELVFHDEEDLMNFYNCITSSLNHTRIALLCYTSETDQSRNFIKYLKEKLIAIEDISSRQYADKLDCFDDFVYVTRFINALDFENTSKPCPVSDEIKILTVYTQSLLLNESNMSTDQILLFDSGKYLMAQNEHKNIYLELYNLALSTLIESASCSKRLLSVIIIKNLMRNETVAPDIELETDIFIKHVLNTTSKFSNSTDNNGKVLNKFYENSCEILSLIVNNSKYETHELENLINILEQAIDCGGYGCLKWILKVINCLLPHILKSDVTNNMIDIPKFLQRCWNEIEELKCNNQYNVCIEEFIAIFTNSVLIHEPSFTNIIINYSTKIIEYGFVSNTGLYHLANRMSNVKITLDSVPFIYILCDLLLFCPVPRRDQRHIDRLVTKVANTFNEATRPHYFNYEIQNIAVSTLVQIKEQEIFEIILLRLITRVSEILKNKRRYHENSQIHRILFTCTQHILFISLLKLNEDAKRVVHWYVDIMVKLPHQPNVRIYMEWFIAIYLTFSEYLDYNVKAIHFHTIPVVSQIMILFLYLRHKGDDATTEEFVFVMDKILSYAMGQGFNVRLTAQYLALTLYQKFNRRHSTKYGYTMEVIEKTLRNSANEKSYVKLQNDFMVNYFDIVAFLKPEYIYYYLPRYLNVASKEEVSIEFLPTTEQCLDYLRTFGNGVWLSTSWSSPLPEETKKVLLFVQDHVATNDAESENVSPTIQKKYVPWRNMMDIDVYDVGKKKEFCGELIVVASLVDKLPNLGGMARTSEVLGVHTYVVDSLHHLQDRQFQGLSVSAERWVNIEEVRPGKPLKDYITKKRTDGYTIVAAEQTSSSTLLQNFQFPPKTLLLLGHEKQGVPYELLPLMDHCVEIPQQGFVRSLNVHVTASVFIWEYVKQNNLVRKCNTHSYNMH